MTQVAIDVKYYQKNRTVFKQYGYASSDAYFKQSHAFMFSHYFTQKNKNWTPGIMTAENES